MQPQIIEGDILDQEVEVIINPWNRNIIPWWLLLPQGVSGAIKRRGGNQPFKDLAKMGAIPLGQARETNCPGLGFKSIIHVAGINLCWFATARSVADSVRSAVHIINQKGYKSAAFPLIGAGSGNRSAQWSLALMQRTFASLESEANIIIVRYVKNRDKN